VNLIHAVPLALLGLFWMKVSPLAILGGFLLGMCLSAAATAAGMLIDAQRPKLTWVNEAEAIKQNMNGFFGMLISFALVALVGVGCAALLLETNLPVLLLFVAALALSAALLILFYLALVKIARSAWPGIDV